MSRCIWVEHMPFKKSNETSIRVVDAEYWLTSCELGVRGSHGNMCVVDQATGASGSSEQQLLIDFTASDDAVALVIWICKHMLFVFLHKYHIGVCSALGLHLYPRLVGSNRVCLFLFCFFFHIQALFSNAICKMWHLHAVIDSGWVWLAGLSHQSCLKSRLIDRKIVTIHQ